MARGIYAHGLAQADATVKLYAAGIIPREQAWMDMGYTPVQRVEMARMFELSRSQTPSSRQPATSRPAPATRRRRPAMLRLAADHYRAQQR